MVDLVVKQAALAANTVFRNRVQVMMLKAASDIQGEAFGAMVPGGSLYRKRQTYANAVLSSPAAHLDRFCLGVVTNTTIAAAIANPISISSSTNANPIVVTTTTHGYTTGDTVEIAGHLVNTNANGGWIITVVSATTFSIPTAGNGVGAATGTATKQPTDTDIQNTINALFGDFAGVTLEDT